ncbi:hypothetical protein BDW02DRAFT_505740 [Decorospora gaudefroyi]|uniref:Rhodopsin domain-containing protein n=1 Tax=Decorospora gaudefroyi TaxID=184978 RepID=A0A6A5K4L1_9PLEO|nr:hypothetical protein BDW02DRAFT_505740 [Decorospora gaudefroyi]
MGHVVYVAPSNDQGPLLNRVCMAMYAVALGFVALRRCFTRGYIVKKFGLDDLFIAIAVTLGGAQTVTMMLQVQNGEGQHSSELHVDMVNAMLMWRLVNMLIYFVANWAVKMSILALYYRIGYGRQGLPWIVQSKSVWATAGLMTVFSLSHFLVQLFVCRPISRAWDIEQLPHGCFNGPLFMMISGAINVATDVVLLLFPLPLLPLFKYNRRQRMALALILSIGVIPVVASTMRLCEIVVSDSPVMKGISWQEADFSWGWSWVPVWSQIEVDVGIVAASLPCLSPLLKQVWVGFCHTQNHSASTPSQMRTVPGYRESWEKGVVSVDFESDKDDFGFGMDVEKRLTVREKEMGKDMQMSWFEDGLSDVDEDEDGDADEGRRRVGVAQTSDGQVVSRTEALPRVVGYTQL